MGKEDPIKTCVQYDDHCKLMCTVLCSLMEHQSLVDLAIRCGNNTMHAHKCILAASSPYFREQLEKNPGTEQVIINGLDFATMKSVVEFIYCGETNILEENMKFVIAAAKLFQIRGLQALAEGGACDTAENQIYIPAPVFINKKPKYSNPYVPFVANSSDPSHTSTCNEQINDPNTIQVQVMSPVGECEDSPMNVVPFKIEDSIEKTDDKANTSFYDNTGSNVEILYTTPEGEFVTVPDDVLSNLSESTVQFQIVNDDSQESELKLLDDKMSKSQEENAEKCENLTSAYKCQDITNNYECQNLANSYERQNLDDSFDCRNLVNSFDCEDLEDEQNELNDPLNQSVDINVAVDSMLMNLRNDHQNIPDEDNIFRSLNDSLSVNDQNNSAMAKDSFGADLCNEESLMDFIGEPVVPFTLPCQTASEDNSKSLADDEATRKIKSEEDAQKMVDVLTNLISPFHSVQNDYQQLLYDLEKSYNPTDSSNSTVMPGPLQGDATDYNTNSMTLRTDNSTNTLNSPYDLSLENNFTGEGFRVYNDNIFGDSNYTDYSTIATPPQFGGSEFPLCQQVNAIDNVQSAFTSQNYGAVPTQRFDERASLFLRNDYPFLQNALRDLNAKTLKKQKTIDTELDEDISSLLD